MYAVFVTFPHAFLPAFTIFEPAFPIPEATSPTNPLNLFQPPLMADPALLIAPLKSVNAFGSIVFSVFVTIPLLIKSDNSSFLISPDLIRSLFAL